MTDSTPSLGPELAELDPSLEQWLGEARALETDAEPNADFDAMFGALESAIDEADKRPTFKLRSQSTAMRRAIAGGASLLVCLVGGVLTLRADFADYPPLYMGAAVLSLSTLLGLAVFHALRPLHRPPLSFAAQFATVALTLGTTVALAMLSPHDAHDPATAGLLQHVSPCLFYGLLVGVPVFLVLRLLDRGHASTSLLAACAAGLTGNLALQLHCQHNAPEHLMFAHFGVVLLFVLGLGGAQLLARLLRR